MATLTPIDRERMNPREANILEEARLRKITIQNMMRENLEAQSIWRDKQMKSYGSLIPITPDNPLSKIITDEIQAESQDEFLIKQHAMANLNTIADQANAEYIIDRLTPEQMRYMNDNWLGIMRRIRKTNSRMDKNVFVNSVVEAANNPNNYLDYEGEEIPDPTGAVGTVDRPSIAARKALKEAEAQNVADQIAMRTQREEAEKKAQEDSGRRLNFQRRIEQTGNLLSTRSRIPAITQAQQAGINAAVLTSQLQEIQDRAQANTAGGNQTSLDPVPSPVPTVGNMVRLSATPASLGNIMKESGESPFLSPKKGYRGSLDSTAISQALNLPDITEQDRKEYSRELESITNDAREMNYDKVKSALVKILGGPKFKSSMDELKSTTGTVKINLPTYKQMYITAAFYKTKSLLPLDASSGTGLKKPKRVIRGRGYVKHEHPTKKPRRHYIGQSYYVDLNKLDDNILCVKYASNDSTVPSSKNQQISDKTKEMIHDILSDKFDERIYKLLTSDEKRVVKRFIKAVKLDINISDEDEKEFQKQFEIVRGEYLSGNSSPEIKAALKRYVLEALKENKIPRHEGYSLLYTLSL